MNRFIFELANPEDGRELLEIIEETTFSGKISLLYTRRPDAFLSLKSEGEEVDIVICRDLLKKKIAGFGACAIRNLFVNGKKEKVGYLFGLRARKEYRGIYPLLHKGYEFLHNHHKDKNIKLYITTILEDNIYAQKLLERNRKFMPVYKPIGFYEVYAIKKVINTKISSILSFERVKREDLPMIIEFLNKEGKNYQFFPVLEESDLLGKKIPGLTYKNFYFIHCKKEIYGAGAIWNQINYKQYIIKGYGGIMKLLYPFSFLFPLFGYPALPHIGKKLNFFTLSFWLIKDNNPEIMSHFIYNISRISQGFSFFLVGVHERNPIKYVIEKNPHIKYRSKVYLVYWNDENPVTLNEKMIPYLECGML